MFEQVTSDVRRAWGSTSRAAPLVYPLSSHAGSHLDEIPRSFALTYWHGVPTLLFRRALAFCAQIPVASARADTIPNRAVATLSSRSICVGWTWSHLFAPIERNLGNQTNMIRFGVIAVFSAMYIIWWRK